ncbi:MAG: DsbA family protein [Gemmatirosa sp.]
MTRLLRGLPVAPLTAAALLACAPDASGGRPDAGVVADAQAAPAQAVSLPTNAAAAAPSAERSARRVVLNGIDLTGVGYDKGSPTAPIVMVDFSDFGCPYCGSHARQTLPELEREFIATGKVFYKYVPLVMGSFPNGDTAARAAECAAEEGKFWPMHDRLYAGQQEWRKNDTPTPVYQRYAQELGLDPPRFAACLADGRTETRTQQASAVAQRLGIRATPTFAIDGEGIEGALPLDVFQKLLREKVAR